MSIEPEAILGLAKSINDVAAQGIKNGEEIANRKYAPLLQAAKEILSFRGTTPANASEDQSWELAKQRLKAAISLAEGK